MLRRTISIQTYFHGSWLLRQTMYPFQTGTLAVQNIRPPENGSLMRWYVHRALLTWTLGGLGAGGDTSANVIRALFYNLFAHPKTLHRLESEISKAKKSDGQLTWREIRSIAYLDACIKEAARIQPSIGLPLERVVPVGGAKISGCYFPEGTVVGINAWVVNRDNEIYGEDANTWRPERWLCEKENRNKMEQTLFTVRIPTIDDTGRRLTDWLLSSVLGIEYAPVRLSFL